MICHVVGEGYDLIEAGERQCPTGYSKILSETECKDACKQVGINRFASKFKDGKTCYKSGRGVCTQNNAFGKSASLICKLHGNLIQIQCLVIKSYNLYPKYTLFTFSFPIAHQESLKDRSNSMTRDITLDTPHPDGSSYTRGIIQGNYVVI